MSMTGPDELAAEYDAVRPPFSETLSPRLPGGLNLGAQIFWQERRFPAAFAAARSYVNYPQYWTWRLSGVAATEMCSMGAHSDLWQPAHAHLVEPAGAARLGREDGAACAPLSTAGRVRPELARRLGLDAATPVLCGLHDSSASLLPHLKQRQPPFTVVSTGTWVILFAVGGGIENLEPERDTLANVTAYGDAVPVGRFMGGREFDLLTAGDPAVAERRRHRPRPRASRSWRCRHLLRASAPSPPAKGRWSVDSAGLSPGERNAAASLYLALVTAESIRCAGGAGPVVIEGPFARNHLFCSALSAIGGYPVERSETSTGTTPGGGAAGDSRHGEMAFPADAGGAAQPCGPGKLRRGVAARGRGLIGVRRPANERPWRSSSPSAKPSRTMSRTATASPWRASRISSLSPPATR